LIGNHEGATGRYKNPDECGLERPAGLGEIEREKMARKAGIDYIRAHPLRTIRRWPSKLEYTFVTSSDVAYWAFQKEFGILTEPGRGEDKSLYLATKSAGEMFTKMILGLAAFAVFILPVLRKRLGDKLVSPATAWLMVGYSALLSVAFFGNPRFAFPVLPLLVMYACAAPVALTYVVARLPLPPDEPSADEPTESQSL